MAPGTLVHTDGHRGYLRLKRLGYDHQPRSQLAAVALGEEQVVPRVHRAISNLKSWLQGTHHSVSGQHLQVYLREFTFRFNRRRTPMAAFQTLLGLGVQQAPMTYAQVIAAGPGAARSAAESTG